MRLIKSIILILLVPFLYVKAVDELYIKVKVESIDKASNTIHATGLTGPCKGYHLKLKGDFKKADIKKGDEIFVSINSNVCENNGVYELKEVSP
ncbi:MAG: hypothetical protein N2Z81_05350 [Hydrogenothermaceae bacterium]|nr:hypothetical protein [Hydrogenothermaceae bacterium]